MGSKRVTESHCSSIGPLQFPGIIFSNSEETWSVFIFFLQCTPSKPACHYPKLQVHYFWGERYFLGKTSPLLGVQNNYDILCKEFHGWNTQLLKEKYFYFDKNAAEWYCVYNKETFITVLTLLFFFVTIHSILPPLTAAAGAGAWMTSQWKRSCLWTLCFLGFCTVLPISVGCSMDLGPCSVTTWT